MRRSLFPYAALLVLGCSNASSLPAPTNGHAQPRINPKTFEKDSWQYFLQNLPVIDTAVIDYRGRPVEDQHKHAGVIPYDVGNKDLQQCADALIRLRAEYLFQQKRYDEIGFHFTGGQFYSWNDYCKGLRPVPHGNQVKFVMKHTAPKTHASLRRYLDLVYTYAGTISLVRELKPAKDFEVGTVVIYAGSPGHCFIIIDEAVNEKGEKLFRLAEGYTPAQSIYVLRHPSANEKTAWQSLSGERIETASYVFKTFKLGKFE